MAGNGIPFGKVIHFNDAFGPTEVTRGIFGRYGLLARDPRAVPPPEAVLEARREFIQQLIRSGVGRPRP